MDQKQFDEVVEKLGEQAALKIKSLFDEKKEGLLTPAQLTEKLSEYQIKGIEDIKIQGKSIEDILKEQGEELSRLKTQSEPSQKSKDIATALVDGYKDMVAKGDIFKLKKGQWEVLELKVAGTMGTGNIDGVGTDSIPYNLASFEPGVTGFVRRNPFIAQLMNRGRTNKMYVQWTEMANADGGASTTAQGAAKSQYDFDLVEKSMKVEKITAYTKVTKEMLDDVGFIEAEIRNELITIIALKLDEQLLSGDGTSPNLKGILEYAQTFAAGSFAEAVENANYTDVLRVAIQLIEAANFQASHIVLNPADVAKMDLQKGTDGHYIMPPFTSASGNVIKGVPIVANNGVTAGDFLVGDFSKSNLRIREDVALSVGLENDDFTKNLVTILAELRAVHYVKSQHEDAFVKGTFTTAIEAIDATV